MEPLKLTNFRTPDNWDTFYNALYQSDKNGILLLFSSDGSLRPANNLKEALDEILELFKISSSFREVFTGYDQNVSNSIVSSISIESNGSKNRGAILLKMFDELLPFDASFNSNVIIDDEDEYYPVYTNEFTKSYESQNGFKVYISPTVKRSRGYGKDSVNKTSLRIEYGGKDVDETIMVKLTPAGKIVSATNYNGDEISWPQFVPDLQTKIIELLEITPPARPNTGASFAPQLTKMTTVQEFKDFLGEQVLFINSSKNMSYDELDSRKKSLSSDSVFAFRVSPKGFLSYHEYPTYCVSFMDTIRDSFTEITGENNTYGPKKNITDEKILAFLKFNCKKNAKMTLSPYIWDDALLTKLGAFVAEHKEQWKNASDLLKPLNETQKYKETRKAYSVPKSFVFYNCSSGTSEYRFELGGNLYSFNGGTYSTRPILEKQEKNDYDFLSGRFLQFSNYSPSNGYNENWSVYKASVAQKKELYKYFEAATVAYKNYVKLMQDWYSKLV
jgi:hypothetical protein